MENMAWMLLITSLGTLILGIFERTASPAIVNVVSNTGYRIFLAR